jgi:hypothetical protein
MTISLLAPLVSFDTIDRDELNACLIDWDHWLRKQTAARAHRNSPRTECLWINPAAQAALHAGPLFQVPA